jgi:Predicted sugar kinase
MKVALFGKALAGENYAYMRQMFENFRRRNIGVSIYKYFLPALIPSMPDDYEYDLFESREQILGKVDIILSVGGDGTILDLVPLVLDSGMPILGVNMGRLGFLSCMSKDDISRTITMLLEGKYTLEPRSVLELVSNTYLADEMTFALNELSVIRNPEFSFLDIKVYVDGVYLSTYWGDGILVATPTGSTAYSLSAGGPIITPNSKSFVITPIAAHNLTVRPIIIPDDSEVTIHVEGRDKIFVFSLDSRSCKMDNSITLVVRKAKFYINLVRLDGNDFFSAIRNKLMWGKDNRN